MVASHPHTFSSPRDYYRKEYYQACDLLLRELTDRFDQKGLLPQLLSFESLLIKAANGEYYDMHCQWRSQKFDEGGALAGALRPKKTFFGRKPHPQLESRDLGLLLVI